MHMEHHSVYDLLSNWNHCHGAFFQIRECDLRWNIQEQDYLTYQLGESAGVPILWAVATEKGIAHGIPARTWWLSLYGQIPAGKEVEFVRGIKTLAEMQEKTRISIGADEFHFLPGVPESEAEGSSLKRALIAEGFQGVDAVDFLGRLDTEPVQKSIVESEKRLQQEGWSFVEVNTPELLSLLDSFLCKEFPGRWYREFRFWRERSDATRAAWGLLLGPTGPLGFARYAIRSRVLPLEKGWNPGALRLSLHEGKVSASDGCLGPIGVASSERGKGIGRVLLGVTLSTLCRNNAEGLCIDWTQAYNYYMPLGFEPARKYWNCWMSS